MLFLCEPRNYWYRHMPFHFLRVVCLVRKGRNSNLCLKSGAKICIGSFSCISACSPGMESCLYSVARLHTSSHCWLLGATVGKTPSWNSIWWSLDCKCCYDCVMTDVKLTFVLLGWLFNPQKATLGIRTLKATWGQMWPHHENGYN